MTRGNRTAMTELRNCSYEDILYEPCDVALFDPPFDEWEKVYNAPKARTYVCFTNFQNRHHVTEHFGDRPKFELIWHFKDGRWVSHNMPRHTHEHILIYGETPYDAYAGPLNESQLAVRKGAGAIGRDKNLGNRMYQPRERKMLNSVIEVPRNVGSTLGVWSKPEKLIVPILQWLTRPKETIWDGFAGSGTFGVCAARLGLNYIGSEIDPTICKAAQRRIQAITTQAKLL